MTTSPPIPNIGDGPIPAAFVREMQIRFGTIPGCSLGTLRETDDGGTHVAFSGWSPSLHAVSVKMHVPVDPIANGSEVMQIMTPVFELQQRRADAAFELGVALPFPVCLALRKGRTQWHTQMPEIRHLWMDRSLLAVILEDNHETSPLHILRRIVAEPLAQLHGVRPGPHSRISGNLIALDDDGGRPIVEPMVMIARGLKADRGGLVVPGSLVPAVAAAAAVGRPLRDLVDAPPAYADRIIAGIKTPEGTSTPANADGIVVHLVPDLVRLDAVVPDWPKSIPTSDAE